MSQSEAPSFSTGALVRCPQVRSQVAMSTLMSTTSSLSSLRHPSISLLFVFLLFCDFCMLQPIISADRQTDERVLERPQPQPQFQLLLAHPQAGHLDSGLEVLLQDRQTSKPPPPRHRDLYSAPPREGKLELEIAV